MPNKKSDKTAQNAVLSLKKVKRKNNKKMANSDKCVIERLFGAC